MSERHFDRNGEPCPHICEPAPEPGKERDPFMPGTKLRDKRGGPWWRIVAHHDNGEAETIRLRRVDDDTDEREIKCPFFYRQEVEHFELMPPMRPTPEPPAPTRGKDNLATWIANLREGVTAGSYIVLAKDLKALRQVFDSALSAAREREERLRADFQGACRELADEARNRAALESENAKLADELKAERERADKAEARVKEVELSCLAHFQRDHLEGDGPEIDRWKRKVSALQQERDGLRERVLAVCEKRGWSLHWTHRSAYLHLEAAELAEAVRGKRGDDTLGESADVLITLLALSPHGLGEIVPEAYRKLETLMDRPPYPGEERAALASSGSGDALKEKPE